MNVDEVRELMDKNLITQVLDPVDVVNNMETPSTGGCDCTDYVLPVASDTTLGGVKIGSALGVDSNEKLGIRLGAGLGMDGHNQLQVCPASSTTLGGVKIGDGLTIDADGKLSTAGGGSGFELGTGLGLNVDGKLYVQSGNGLTMDGDALTVKVGDGLDTNDNGALHVTMAGSIDGKLGGVKVGTSINSSRCPYAKIGINRTTGEIGLNYGAGLKTNSVAAGQYHSALEINYGDGLGIDSNGKLYVTGGGSGGSDYQLPIASETTLGGIMVGDGFLTDADGKLHVNYQLPKASPTNLGGIKVGDGLSSNSDGTLKVNIGSGLEWSSTDPGFVNVKYGQGLSMDNKGTLYATSGYTLPAATKTTLGGVKAGNGLDIGYDGTIHVNIGSTGLCKDSQGSLGVDCGDGLDIDENGKLKVLYGYGLKIGSSGELYVSSTNSDYTLGTATETTLGGVKVGNGLSIDSSTGRLSVKTGDGMKMESGGSLGINLGTGLYMGDNGICVDAGQGLIANTNSQLIPDIDYIYRQILTKLQNDGYIQ